jgi:hypothetical protein
LTKSTKSTELPRLRHLRSRQSIVSTESIMSTESTESVVPCSLAARLAERPRRSASRGNDAAAKTHFVVRSLPRLPVAAQGLCDAEVPSSQVEGRALNRDQAIYDTSVTREPAFQCLTDEHGNDERKGECALRHVNESSDLA